MNMSRKMALLSRYRTGRPDSPAPKMLVLVVVRGYILYLSYYGTIFDQFPL